MLFLIGIIAGFALPNQTSINSRLGHFIKSPYLASAISMTVAAIFMIIVSLITKQPLIIPLSYFTHYPWWIWIGGIVGDLALTFNIMLLPRLGAVQTIIMPLIGQIIMSMLIDNFGWFNLPIHHFNLLRLLGIIVMFIGVLLIVIRKESKTSNKIKRNILPWQIFGVFTGFLLAIQTSINGALHSVLNSPIRAGNFAFISGAILILIAVGIIQHNFNNIKNAIGSGKKWWIWIGGVLGALYTVGNLYLSPILGTGTDVVVVLLGNMIGSIIIDKYGLYHNLQRPIHWRHYLGVVILLLGVIAINYF